MKKYDHKKIEKKWQKEWRYTEIYKTSVDSNLPKQYVLDMFPYPSGDGLHVGHPRGYIATDVYSRMKRMQGYNVLHPMGWDAFGLPAENFAIKNKVHPRVAVEKNVTRFKEQLSLIGFNYDWSREVNTTDPEFYKWTQWIFLQMYKKGLAYESFEPINWCPSCMTGLANEDVEGDGTCERCGTVVEKKPMRQWVLKITDYADRMLEDLDKLPKWPTGVKEAQRNWIGKSEGLIFSAKVKDSDIVIKTFSAHFEACYADTFFVIAPDHPLLPKLLEGRKEKDAVLKKAQEIIEKRNSLGEKYKDMDGIFTGRYAIDPLGNGDLPIWVGSFVLKDYGTGIVKCSAHDERDFAFAKKFNIKLKEVIIPKVIDEENPPLSDKKTVERNAIQAIIINPKNGKVLSLRWKDFPWTTFIVGGVEGDEDIIQAARREILEETGYKNLKYIRTLGGQVESHFYAAHKNENRRGYFNALVFELENEEREDTKDEEKKLHEVHWASWEELKKDKNLKCSEYDIWMDRFFNPPHPIFDGVLTLPLEFKGREIKEVRNDIADWLVKKGFAKRKTTYKIRDWVFSRQRYWGEPIPIIHCEGCGVVPVPEADLPILLPEVKSYEPTGTGESPLANIKDWVNTKCPKCEGKAKRETNTMPQWAGSSWYYLRYIDPKNSQALVDKEKEKKWMPVDVYVGGDHATRHLIYARFWHKFLFDIGVVSTEEPFPRLEFLGFILAEDGRKMSKRWKNVVNPDDVVARFGADAFRLYEMFIGPFENTVRWNNDGMVGTYRFLERVYKFCLGIDKNKKENSKEAQKIINKNIKKITDDIENFKFNTAVSSLMICLNELEKIENISVREVEIFLKLLAPFAPHIAEDIWNYLGNKESIHISTWPEYNRDLALDEEVKIMIQVNGKLRGEIMIALGSAEEDVKKQALLERNILKYVADKNIKRIIYVKNRVINIII